MASATNLQFHDKNDSHWAVVFTQKLESLPTISITVSKAGTLDLSMLNGLTGISSWGDGSSNDYNSLSHTYSDTGTFSISGDFSNVTSIGDDFFSSVGSTSTIKITDFDFSSLSAVTSVGNKFFYAQNVKEPDFSFLSNVTSIGNNFYYGSTYLTSIDLTPFSNVTSIGDSFLYYDTKLTSIDVSPLTKVESVGSNFLRKHTLLTAATGISSMSSLKTIGDYFFAENTGLTSLEFSVSDTVTQIGSYFLYGNSKMASVKRSDGNGIIYNGWNLTSIGDYFMANCTKLTDIGTTPFSGCWELETVGSNFMANDTAFTKIPDNMFQYAGGDPCVLSISGTPFSGCTALTEIGNNFCCGSGVVSFDYSALTAVTKIGSSCMADSEVGYAGKNMTLDTAGLSAVTEIGGGFYKYARLSSADFSGLSALETTDGKFCDNLLDCPTEIDLSAMTSLKTIGDSFFSGCSNLTNVTLPTMTNVETIGYGFFKNCTQLATIQNSSGYFFCDCTALTSIGDDFMSGCTALTSPFFSFGGFENLNSLATIGKNFMANDTGLTSFYGLKDLSDSLDVGSGFLKGCTNVAYVTSFMMSGGKISVDLSEIADSVTSIGYNCFGFLTDSTNSLTLPFSNVTSISSDKCFLGGSVFATLDMTAMTGLETLALAEGDTYKITITDFYAPLRSPPTLTNPTQLTATTVHCGEYLSEYQAADGWKDMNIVE